MRINLKLILDNWDCMQTIPCDVSLLLLCKTKSPKADMHYCELFKLKAIDINNLYVFILGSTLVFLTDDLNTIYAFTE